jgi:hypothetical protein
MAVTVACLAARSTVPPPSAASGPADRLPSRDDSGTVRSSGLAGWSSGWGWRSTVPPPGPVQTLKGGGTVRSSGLPGERGADCGCGSFLVGVGEPAEIAPPPRRLLIRRGCSGDPPLRTVISRALCAAGCCGPYRWVTLILPGDSRRALSMMAWTWAPNRLPHPLALTMFHFSGTFTCSV